MRPLLLVLLMATTAAAQDRHHFWTRPTNPPSQPRETLKPSLKLVYVDDAGDWVNDAANNISCDLWLAPSKNYAVGYMRAILYVQPLGRSKPVFELTRPVITDYPETATHQRWFLKRNVIDLPLPGDTNELTFLGHTQWQMNTTIAYNRDGHWIWGLNGLIHLPSPIPPGRCETRTFDISQWAEHAYNVGQYKLLFEQGLPSHNPGISAVGIKGISMLLWEDADPEEPEPTTYNATTVSLPNITICQRIAVQRKGDANLDGKVNGLDVDAFTLAFDETDYKTVYWGVPPAFNCDMNYDGAVNGLDVDLFIAALFYGGWSGDYWDLINYD